MFNMCILMVEELKDSRVQCFSKCYAAVTSLFLYSDGSNKLFGLAGSFTVDCFDSKQVLLVLVQLLDGVLKVSGLQCGHFHPFVSAKLAGFDDVARQSAATVVIGLLPAQDDGALGDVDHLQLVWRQRHLANQDDVGCLAGLTDTIDVLRKDPEVVQHALHEAVDLVRGLTALGSDGLVGSHGCLTPLNDVVVDRSTAIHSWGFPRNGCRLLGQLLDLDCSSWSRSI